MHNKKDNKWIIIFVLSLISVSVGVHFIHYKIFHDLHHLMMFLLGDIAFVPIEVILVTLVIHKVLDMKEKKSRLKKMNMVIGTFFSETGYQLLKFFHGLNENKQLLESNMALDGRWNDGDFKSRQVFLSQYKQKIVIKDAGILKDLKTELVEQRSFLLGLLQNPNLLEHEGFTDLLWAVFHLMEELYHRKQKDLPAKEDLDHLIGDINRAYTYLMKEWLIYMQSLKKDYPYLYSLAVRTNPFRPDAQVEVT